MSASHRKLARLPLEIFDNLQLRVACSSNTKMSPLDLRTQICNRLKRFAVPNQSARGTSTTASVKTVGELLRANQRALLVALDPILTFAELQLMLQRICKICSAKNTSAWSLLESTNEDLPIVDTQSSSFGENLRYLPTGLQSLDSKLQGGIRVGSVTEIVGRAGAGKTQLAFQLCLLAAKYNQGCMYIDTERKISLERLAEMSQHCYHRDHPMQNATTNDNNGGNPLFSYSDSTNSQQQQEQALQPNNHPPNPSQQSQSPPNYFKFKSPDEVLANFMVKTPSSTEELILTLNQVEEDILQRNLANDPTWPVRVLVVDSIAAPLRRDFGSDAYRQRSAAIFACAQTLRRLAETLHLAVVVINQVGAVAGDSMQATSLHSVKAALGTSWHHCVSTRLVLDQLEMQEARPELGQYHGQQEGWTDFGNLASTKKRTVDIAKSNIVPHATIQFEICNAGIVDPQNNSSSITM